MESIAAVYHSFSEERRRSYPESHNTQTSPQFKAAAVVYMTVKLESLDHRNVLTGN